MIDKNSKVTVIEDSAYGLYLWMKPDGQLLMDDDGNCLNIPAKKGDIMKMKRISDVAKVLGFDGHPIFYSASRRVTDDEFWEQMNRMAEGYVPDPYDIGVAQDERRHGRAK
jgi:hypothetical protein